VLDIQDMPRKTPILGLAQGGDGDDMFYLNGQIADHARTPPRIAGRANVFAIWTSGDSMFPWRASGDLVYVEERPVRVGDYVILEMQPDAHDTRPAILKRLAAQTPTKIRLEQYNPQKTIEIDRRKIVRMLRVIDWPELLG
jgi:phage repressor protein C with HTH and peptisase S24 domain